MAHGSGGSVRSLHTGGDKLAFLGKELHHRKMGNKELSVIDLYNLLASDRPELFLSGPGLQF